MHQDIDFPAHWVEQLKWADRIVVDSQLQGILNLRAESPKIFGIVPKGGVLLDHILALRTCDRDRG